MYLNKLPRVVLLEIIEDLNNHDSIALTSTCRSLNKLRRENKFWLKMINHFGRYFHLVIKLNLNKLERLQLSKCKGYIDEASKYSTNKGFSIQYLKNQYRNRKSVDTFNVRNKQMVEDMELNSHSRYSITFKKYIDDIEITNVKTIPYCSNIIVGGYEKANGSPYLFIIDFRQPYEVCDLIYRSKYYSSNYTERNPYAINSIDCKNNLISFSNRFNNEIQILNMNQEYTRCDNIRNSQVFNIEVCDRPDIKIKFSSDSRLLGICTNDGQTLVYDVEYKKQIWESKNPKLPVNNICWDSNDDNQLFSCGEIIANSTNFYNNTGYVRGWDIRVDSNRKTKSWTESIECGDLSLSPDNNYLAYVLRKGVARNIDLRTNQIHSTYLPQGSETYNFQQKTRYHTRESILWLPGYHNFLASTCEPRSINIWNSDNGKLINHIDTKQESDLSKFLQIDMDCNGLYLFSNRGRVWGINDLSEISLFSNLNSEDLEDKKDS